MPIQAALGVLGAPDASVWPSRRSVEADSLLAAQEALSETYSPLTLGTPRAGSRLRMRLHAVSLPQLSISELELTTTYLRAGRHPWYSLCLPLHGEVEVSCDKISALVGGRYGAILAPDSQVAGYFRSDLASMRVLQIEQAALQDELAMMLGRALDRPLRFDLQVDKATAGAALRRSLNVLAAELVDATGLLSTPPTAVRLERLVMASLLVSLRHNYSDQLNAPAGNQSPRTIRRAMLAIEEDPTGFDRVSQIASTAGLSVRALEEGFQRHVGVSPMRYLRQVRLARAHAALLAADADQTTATAIAYAWGFPHYGRFAADYQKAYGRSPYETLKSTRAG